MRSHSSNKLSALHDSKKLTPKQRDAWYAHLTRHPRIRYAVARVYPRQIEKRNISRAANLAAWRAFTRLAVRGRVFLDGGLFLKDKAHSASLKAKTIIKGDENIPAVAMASIIAKVTRDRFMKRMAEHYPGYGFELHKGYGTRAHLAAVRRIGPSPIHRRTFLS
jgi:ribonuclease HII